MHEVRDLLYCGLCVGLIAVIDGCAVGAPERPAWDERPILAFPEDGGADDAATGRGPTPQRPPPSSANRDAAQDEAPAPPDDDNDDDNVTAEPAPGGARDAGAGGALALPPTPVVEDPPDAGAPEPFVDPDPSCLSATLLWSEDFESGDYGNWTSQTYGADWGDDCQSNAITTEGVHSGTRAQRSEITCAYTAEPSHRGHGELQFDGDQIAPELTNTGVGIDAPHGLVNTTWVRLDSDTVFENGLWISLMSVRGDCTGAETDKLLGLGIEDSSGRLAAAHYQFGAGGTRTFDADGPTTFPRHSWVRITTYLNYHAGVMHVWQDGRSLQHVTFSRPLNTICRWRWGLYAAAENTAIVLLEDDNSLWKLEEPWTDFDTEPLLGESVAVCEP